MGTGGFPRDRGRRFSWLAAAVLALSGASCVGIAATHRQSQEQPQPPLSTVSATGSSTTPPVLGSRTASATPPVSPSPTSSSVTSPVLTPSEPGPLGTGLALPASTPVALVIPAIGVRTPLLELGLSALGALETPKGAHYDEAGWYRYSPTPGSVGPAVIAGHVDSAANGPSVFFRLSDLKPADRVMVTRTDGSVAVFAVDQVLRYRKTGFPTELVYGDTNRAVLRLITCGGRFDQSSGQYLDNIVVLASLVSTAPVTPAGRHL